MLNITHTPTQWTTTPLKKYLQAGLLAASAAALLNLTIYLTMMLTTNNPIDPLTLGSILIASFLPNLIATLALFTLTRWLPIPHARPLYTLGITLLVLSSILPHLGIGPAPSPALAALPPGFNLMTIPLHLIGGLFAIFVIPYLLNR
ncbi:MAG TPA: hypothetical protein VLL52_14090 [Anaerolineae bacterium]|nr:hypothetical protein [Anaerolineae bacterium]